MRARAAAALFAVVGSAAGCGGSSAPAFRIGMLSDCYGPFAGVHQLNVADAELPLIERGAEPAGRSPSAGLHDVDVAGRSVRLLVGCTSGTEDVIPQARRLVEEQGAQAIIGALSPEHGMALRQYARLRPEVAFVVEPSAAPELTLSSPTPNIFRFELDAAQSTAGLGAYAYRRLGWRRAALAGDAVPYAWEEAAGFVAEFCALGGRIVSRDWIPFGADPGAVAARIPRSADGVFLAPAISPMERFLKAYAGTRGLAGRLLAGSALLGNDPNILPLADGAVVGGSPAFEPTAAQEAFKASFARAFPTIPAANALNVISLGYANGVNAVLDALRRSHGAAGAPLLAALARVRLDSPLGPIRLDGHRQAIGPTYLSRVERVGGRATVRTIRVVPAVEQTFGGYFRPDAAPASATSPACVKRPPPPWAG
jgi:branched-chain amino acid transport system substrate-binding protein